MLCLGRESNPHGRFGPRDFLTTMAFATITVCGPDYSFTMESCSLGVPCLVSAPSFNLKAWLKIAFSISGEGWLEFTACYISLFRGRTDMCPSSLIIC